MNVRVLHLCPVGTVPEVRAQVGSTTTIVPLIAGTLHHWSDSTTVPGAPAVGSLTTSDASESAATAVAVDVVLAVVDGLVAAAIVAAMVWVARFAAWLVAATPSCHICIG